MKNREKIKGCGKRNRLYGVRKVKGIIFEVFIENKFCKYTIMELSSEEIEKLENILEDLLIDSGVNFHRFTSRKLWNTLPEIYGDYYPFLKNLCRKIFCDSSSGAIPPEYFFFKILYRNI